MSSKRRRSRPKNNPEAASDPVASAAPALEQPAPAPKQRKVGVKAQVAALLQAGGEFTVEELQAATGGTAVTVKTALSDLRSPKYAGPTGALSIVRVDGKYSLAKESKS